jgi:RNA polymerase sigma-70 factor (ECF subfamily)
VALLDLEAAIAALPDGYRTVLVLHDVEGFTHEEIGRRLEISPNTSKSQVSRARRALRAALADHRTGTRVDS